VPQSLVSRSRRHRSHVSVTTVCSLLAVGVCFHVLVIEVRFKGSKETELSDCLRSYGWYVVDEPPSVSFDPLRSTWLTTSCDRRRREASCHLLQILDTNFFYAEIQALVPHWDRCLYVCGVWRVPSATCAVCTSKSE
jgi:hypothetical protein